MRASLRFGGGVRIGQVIQSPVDLEALYPGEFMRLDGRDVARAAVSSAFAANFALGVLTPTVRTLAGKPSNPSIAADGNNFLAAYNATTGTGNGAMLQASPDGVTWTTGASWTNSNPNAGPAAIILAGTRFIIAGANGDLVAPYVISTTTGTYGTTPTAANLVNKANWTATTGGTTTTLLQGLVYGATANAGAGRTLLIPNAAGSDVYTLDDGATAWVTRATGLASTTRSGGCWTGQYFVVSTITPGLIHRSADGVTWQAVYVPNATNLNAALSQFASDGNGTVVATNITGAIALSTDHGATWALIQLGNDAATAVSTGSLNVSYLNGKFIAMNSSSPYAPVLHSTNGRTWMVESAYTRIGLALNNLGNFGYKAGTYVFLGINGTSAVSCTEDTTQFRLPSSATGVSAGNTPIMVSPSYIKVA